MHRRINFFAPLSFAISLTILPVLAAQQAPAPSAPSLSVDRDPVPSPDPEAAPAAAGADAAGQQPSTDQIQRAGGTYTLHTEVGEVRLNASVVDGSGRSVQTLPPSAFTVYEDGVQQTVASLRHEDLPVSLGLLIDSSGSMYDKRTAVGKASLDLIKLSNPRDEAFLVDFSFDPYIDADFTHDIKKLEDGLNYVKASGGTALYDAVIASADYLSRNAKEPKQVILLITDGDDNASSSTLEETIRRVQELDGPVIYAVGLLFGPDEDKRESRHARRVLETLAEQTGGVAYFPKKLEDVDAIAAQVAADIRQQYTISYSSTKPARLGGYRTIHVTAQAKGFGKLTVRTRSGYFPKGSQPTGPTPGLKPENAK
ncbi:VWA domain-containing protein [Terriglobus sp. RCC_193]|uniref:VWA domain-containing protein n=1 Tax=Terriglobus sp. RCC_193 TaxID=3239218 RepID=UPI003524D46E